VKVDTARNFFIFCRQSLTYELACGEVQAFKLKIGIGPRPRSPNQKQRGRRSIS